MFRFFGLLVVVAAAAGLLVIAGPEPATGSESPPSTLTLLMPTDMDYTDPALSYLQTGWQMEYATCLKLVNYADNAPARSAAVPLPEAAVALPTVSADGKTYTFTIRDGLQFSPPSNEMVTAATFKHVFERIQSPVLQSPATPFIDDVTGVTAEGQTLTITLSAPNGDLLARLAMPFFCAVPLSAASTELMTPASAGPYYIASRTRNSEITLESNPNYHGSRTSNFDRIVYRVGDSLDVAQQLVESGAADYAVGGIPPTAYAGVNALYGPGSPAAAAGRQRFFVNPQLGFSYLALNTSRPLFANQTLRQAVAYAIDRSPILDQGGFMAGTATDQYLPPGMPGYVDESLYPLNGDLEQAKALAASQGVSPADPVAVELYTSNRSPAPQRAQIIQMRLAQIGMNVTIHQFPRAEQIEREGTRGEPFDIATEGWIADYNDPVDILQLLDGRTIRDKYNNNFSYFDDPVFNNRLAEASRLSGQARYDAYAQIEHDLVRAAPLVAISTYNSRDYFADRIGCQTFGVYGMNLSTLCRRPAAPIATSWTQTTPSVSPPARGRAAMATDGNGKVLLFGGWATLSLGDTWLWNGSGWTQPVLATAPPARNGAAIATTSDGKVVLFGGVTSDPPNPPVYPTGTWVWDGSAWTLASSAVSPPPRSSTGMARDRNGKLVLFGGILPSALGGVVHDTWLWDGSTWSQAMPATSPTSRYGFAMATDKNGNVILFGGEVNGGQSGETWLWNGSDWSQVATAVSPPARSGASMATDRDGNIVLFGGSSEPTGMVADTWIWDGSTWAQAWPSTSPSARANSGLATDQNGNVVLFSGATYVSTAPNDTWLFATTWDTTPPSINVPADITREATGTTGAVVAFTVTATDSQDPSPLVRCTPASGSVFATGATLVTCTAFDASGNVAHATFTVRVTNPAPPSGGGGSGGGGGGGGSGVADLSVAGAVEPASAPVGGTLTWRLRLRDDKNYGPATGVYLDVQLPAGVTLVSAQADRGPGCTETGAQKLHCNLDWLSSDAPYGNVVLVTNVTAPGELVLSATAGYSSADPNPADNTLVLKANTPVLTPPFITPPVVKPVFGRAAMQPSVLRAGTRATFTLPVRRSDNGAPLTAGKMICDPSVSGKLIKHTESFKSGKARLSFLVPKSAKGKQLSVRIKIVSGSQSATRTFGYRVH